MPGAETLGPHLRGVKHTQHRHRRCGFGVNNDVVGSNYQFPCALHPARSAALRMDRELSHLALDFLH